MAHRRTREEKVSAKHVYLQQVPPEQQIRLKIDMGKKSDTSTIFNYPDIVLPTSTMRADLTKTVIVTILALILQFSLAYYLQKDGWSQLLLFISKTFQS